MGILYNRCSMALVEESYLPTTYNWHCNGTTSPAACLRLGIRAMACPLETQPFVWPRASWRGAVRKIKVMLR